MHFTVIRRKKKGLLHWKHRGTPQALKQARVLFNWIRSDPFNCTPKGARCLQSISNFDR